MFLLQANVIDWGSATSAPDIGMYRHTDPAGGGDGGNDDVLAS